MAMSRPEAALTPSRMWKVLHVTCMEHAKPVEVGQSLRFSKSEALREAKCQSRRCPTPNRFVVFNSDDVPVAIYECGKRTGGFRVTPD